MLCMSENETVYGLAASSSSIFHQNIAELHSKWFEFVALDRRIRQSKPKTLPKHQKGKSKNNERRRRGREQKREYEETS